MTDARDRCRAPVCKHASAHAVLTLTHVRALAPAPFTWPLSSLLGRRQQLLMLVLQLREVLLQMSHLLVLAVAKGALRRAVLGPSSLLSVGVRAIAQPPCDVM
jgi:hypothetical protein